MRFRPDVALLLSAASLAGCAAPLQESGTVLGNGAVPLDVLERQVEAYIASKRS